ncbi:MAG: hypothetical protein RL030_307 [Pseudomonadota bacterium]|jgi:hypothetical protein
MSKKTAELSAGLVAVKGAALPPTDMPTRAAPVLAAVPSVPAPPPVVAVVAPSAPPVSDEAPKKIKEGSAANLAPLNFRVSGTFRREFKTYAATHDLKLNELLRLSFEAYRRTNGD